MLNEKVKTPTTAHVGVTHSATDGDLFTKPVLKNEKVRTPTQSYVGVKPKADRNLFTTPVNNEKLKNPTASHVGVKPHGGLTTFFTPTKQAVKMPTVAAHVQAPKGKFQWVKVGGAWKKQYQQEE